MNRYAQGHSTYCAGNNSARRNDMHGSSTGVYRGCSHLENASEVEMALLAFFGHFQLTFGLADCSTSSTGFPISVLH